MELMKTGMEYKMQYLYEKLKEYVTSDSYPFHMPGHKRNISTFSDPFQIDITEIEGFDDLHHAEGILKEAQERAAALYHSEETCFLINGSTAGILSAISACTTIGGKILMARNCHKVVYHSLLLRNLQAEYIYPQQVAGFRLNGGLDPAEIESALINMPEIQAVVITSPTYDGIVSDVGKIAEIVHRHGKPLIVDEAHGAHFGFHSYFPENSVKKGADVVIHSLHKTLPSFTQTALLHINGSIINRKEVRKYLGIFQSSSPSYVLMAGIDNCVRLLSEEKEKWFIPFTDQLRMFRSEACKLEHIRLLGTEVAGKQHVFAIDCSKLLFSTEAAAVSGYELYRELRNGYHLELEMASENYALALTSIGDTEEGFDRLLMAMTQLEQKWEWNGWCRQSENRNHADTILKNEIVMDIYEADHAVKTAKPLQGSIGETAGEFLYLYPPGIPFLVPGERISRELVDRILQYKEKGLCIRGMSDPEGKEILVIDTRSAERGSNGKNILCDG